MAILTMLLTIFWACWKKIIFCSLGILTIIICLSPLSVAFPLGHSRTPEKGALTFKIMSWNVIHTNDLRNPDYPGNRAVEYMINSGADIIGLAEVRDFKTDFTRLSKGLQDSLNRTYPYRDGVIDTDVKILSKYPVERLYSTYMGRIKGPWKFDFFKIFLPDNHELVVGMIHLFSYGLSENERKVVTDIKSMKSAKSSIKELEGPIRNKLGNGFKQRADDATLLREVIDDISPDIPLIICGDFNDVPASWAYNMVKGDDLRDAYAETNFGPAITYNLHAFYFHIDQMLYRGPIEALDLRVGKINTSDHYPLIADFEFTNN